jgi:hypothetical protein
MPLQSVRQSVPVSQTVSPLLSQSVSPQASFPRPLMVSCCALVGAAAGSLGLTQHLLWATLGVDGQHSPMKIRTQATCRSACKPGGWQQSRGTGTGRVAEGEAVREAHLLGASIADVCCKAEEDLDVLVDHFPGGCLLLDVAHQALPAGHQGTRAC